MVQKKERCGQRTGNTIRKHVMSLITHDGYIDYKFINTPDHFEPEKFKKLFNRKDAVFSDGRESFSPLSGSDDREYNDIHINIKHRQGEFVTYSLDKHKRWTLPTWINDNIESLSEEDFRVVLSKRSTITEDQQRRDCGMLYTKYRTWNDCVQYIDSKTPLSEATPTKSASFFTDLRRKCLGGGHIEEKKQARKRKRHNMHSRGVQRKSELQQKMEKVDNKQEYNTYQLLDGADSKEMAEFRYEICVPQGMKSRYNSSKSESFERASKKLPNYFGSGKKSLSKQKGIVNGCRAVWKKFQLKEGLEENEDSVGYGSTNLKGSLTENWICLEEINCSDEVVYAYDASDDEACCVPKKNYIEVEIFDCLKGERRKQKTGNQQKRRRKRKFSEEDLGEKGHVVYLDENKAEEKDEISSTVEASKDSSDIIQEISLPSYVECFFKKTEMEDFLRKTLSFYSTSSHPTIFVIPLQISVLEDENENVNFDGEAPALIVQEKFSSAVLSSEEGIAECRLRIVANEALYSTEKVNRDLTDFLTTQEELLIFSLGEIFQFAKDVLQQNTLSLQNSGQHELCALEPVFDWLPKVTYKVATIKQASLLNYNPLREVPKNLPSYPKSFTGSAKCEYECGVCFAPLSDTEVNSGASDSTGGTLILPCQHSFCRMCLFQYVLEKIKTGARSLSCLEYKCESKIDPVIILSLMPANVFGQWSHRQQEQAVMSTGLWKWCPNKTCNLIVSLSKRDQRVKQSWGIFANDHLKMKGVTCLCHTEFCMECEELPHWPASCQQIGEYIKALNIQKDLLKEEDYVRTFRVNVKPCPSCKEKVDKNGGCNAMFCRCGHHFCWICLKGSPYSPHTCKQVPLQEVELVNSKVVKFQTKYLTKAYSYRVRSTKLIRWRNVLRQKTQDVAKPTRSKCTYIGSDQPQGRISLKSSQLQYLHVLVESVKLLEKVFVSVASSSRKSVVGKELISLADAVDFIISRMSELLHGPLDAKVYTRIERLNIILSKNIKKMVLISLFIQQTRLKKMTVHAHLNISYSVGYD